MRYITIPSDINLVLPGASSFSGILQTFEGYVKHLLDTDSRFNSSGKAVRAAVRIEQAIRSAKGALALEEEDWQLLKQVNEAPTAGYPSLVRQDQSGTVVGTIPVTRQLLPFIDAIDEAKTERPQVLVDSAS